MDSNAPQTVRKEKTRLRIRFSKRGDLRWISHRDLARVWERLLRRANLEMAFSEGFHPKPRISFPSALALGVEALEEIVELEVVGTVVLEEIKQDICREMPDGMELIELASPEYGLGKAKVLSASYRIEITEEQVEPTKQRIEQVCAQEKIEVQREKKVFVFEPQSPEFHAAVEEQYFKFTLPHAQEGSLRPSEMLELVGLKELLEQGTVLQREKVHLKEPERV